MAAIDTTVNRRAVGNFAGVVIRCQRREHGYGMVSAAAFTVVVGAWLAVTVGMVLPTFQKSSEYRYWSVVRNSAEAGLDYAVAQLDTAYRTGVPSAYDDTTIDGMPRVTVLPNNVLASAATVTLAVNNTRAPASASIYSTQLDDQQAGNVVGNANLYRTVSVTSEYAGFSANVRVILKPVMTTNPNPTTNVPFFKYALYSQNALSTSGNTRTDAYDSRIGSYGGSNLNNFRGDVGSNTSVSIGSNTIIGGNLVVFSLPKASSTAVVATRSSNAQVQNQVKVNGITSGFSATNGLTPSGSDNVKALEFGSPRSGDYTTPIDLSLSLDQPTFSVAPNSPQGAYNVGAISVSGNGIVIVRQGAAPVSSINVSANNTIVIPPGNYKATSMSISGNGKIVIESSVTTNSTFFMEGSTPGANVVQISGNGITNNTATPAKFQIMTNSAKNVQVSGNGNFHGVIYAPSANVSISGNGNLFGSVVGQSINASGNGQVHFDLALSDPDYASTNGLTFDPESGGSGSGVVNVINGLKTVSWQEY